MDIKDIEKYLIGKYLYWAGYPLNYDNLREILAIKKNTYGSYIVTYDKLGSFATGTWEKEELINLINIYVWNGNGFKIYLLDNKNQLNLIRLLYG